MRRRLMQNKHFFQCSYQRLTEELTPERRSLINRPSLGKVTTQQKPICFHNLWTSNFRDPTGCSCGCGGGLQSQASLINIFNPRGVQSHIKVNQIQTTFAKDHALNCFLLNGLCARNHQTYIGFLFVSVIQPKSKPFGVSHSV